MAFVPTFFGNTTRNDFAALAIVLVAAAMVAFSGLGDRLCIGGHEALVARTADCMLEQHRFLVPVLNDAPRLNKPPLNYWLAMLADRLVRPDGHVSPFEARLPSVLGGLLMAGFVFVIGRLLLDCWTGLLAGLATVSSFGLAGYTHSAIPEMLYSGLCTAGLAAFFVSERAQDSGKQHAGKVLALLGWGVLGLAALAKGPQVPGIILVGLLAFQARESGWLTAMRKLRVPVGFPLFLAVWVWWYIYIAGFVPQAETLLGPQIHKHWLPQLSCLWRWLFPYPYYPVRVGTLAAPWVLPYALALAAPWVPGLRGNREAKRLWWLIVVGMVVFSIPSHRRWYYLLPLLGVICLLSMAAFRAWSHSWGERHPRGWRVVLSLHAIGLGVASLVLAAGIGRTESVLSRPTGTGLAVLCLAVAALPFKPKLPFTPPGSDKEVRILCLLVTGVLVTTAVLWNGRILADPDAAAARKFSFQVAGVVPPKDTLYTIRGSWKIAQYYLRRNIPPMGRAREAIRRGESVWLLDAGREPSGSGLDGLDMPYEVVLRAPGHRLLRVAPTTVPE